MDVVTSFLGRNGFLPHGFCFQWSPELLWAMVLADGSIALAYFSIPLAIVSFTRRRPELQQQLGWVPWLFSAFIFSCGVTHVMDVWTLWQPDYGLQTLTKIVTAVVSVATAVALWKLIPRALRIPSVQQLQRLIAELESEVGRRRSAEDHALDIERSLAVTLASIEAGYIATDRQGFVTRMNAVAERITGWSQQEALGHSAMEVFEREGLPPDLAAANPVDMILQRSGDADEVHDVVCIARTSGRPTFVELRAGLTRDDAGQVRGLVLVFRDMTVLRQAEADLPRLAAIVESSEDAIIGMTLQGRVTTWNRAADAMFGYTPQEAIGQSVQTLLPRRQEGQVIAFLAALAQGERVLPFDTVRRTKDGRDIDVSVSISPIRNAKGQIVGASKIVRDISDKRRAEAATRDSEARLRFTLEAAQIGDWELDLQTGSTRRSLRHDRCFGYTSPRADWSLKILLQHVHPSDRGAVVHSYKRSLASGDDWLCECRVFWPDGSVHWIGSRASLVEDSPGKRRMLGIVTDISDTKRAEEARLLAQRLEAENRQILAASRLKSQFLANMSHELRTPLNAVIGFSDLLHAGVVPIESPKHHEFLGHIGTSGRHLLQLINDVLDLSKVESGKFEFFPEPVDLQRLVAEVAGVLHTDLQRQHLKFDVQIDPSLTNVLLDPARLKQALYNYLSNAIKFTPDSGRVSLRAMAEGRTHLRVEVEDTGIGIAPTDLTRLFVEFQQLDAGSTKRYAGTGLGLALTRRLVEAQGGSVGVSSVLGQGSVFHLVLPRTPQARGQLGQRVQRLLVVDEDARHRHRLAGPLGAAGYAVDLASSAREALQQTSARSYDGIALGLLPSDQTGLKLLAQIRSSGPNQAAPVVGLSMAARESGQAAFAITDLLAKPMQSDQVLRAMAANGLLAGSNARVMVIDDDPPALDLMRATLQTVGLQATGWLDGRQALNEIDAYRPDAIVLDLMMPGFDGFEVLEALARLPAWRSTPVFIWTSMLLTEEEYAQLALSAQAVLRKGGGDVAWLVDRMRRARPAPVVGQGDAQ